MDVTDLTDTLQGQLGQLMSVAERLGRAREELVPAGSTFWGGSARKAYDRAVGELDGEIGSALELVRLARQNTQLALSAVRHG